MTFKVARLLSWLGPLHLIPIWDIEIMSLENDVAILKKFVINHFPISIFPDRQSILGTGLGGFQDTEAQREVHNLNPFNLKIGQHQES